MYYNTTRQVLVELWVGSSGLTLVGSTMINWFSSTWLGDVCPGEVLLPSGRVLQSLIESGLVYLDALTLIKFNLVYQLLSPILETNSLNQSIKYQMTYRNVERSDISVSFSSYINKMSSHISIFSRHVVFRDVNHQNSKLKRFQQTATIISKPKPNERNVFIPNITFLFP